MTDKEGGYHVEFLQGALPHRLTCLICRLAARDPYQAGCCGKLFCESCLKRWLQQKSCCPHCQESDSKYFRDKRAAQEIGDLIVCCTQQSDGCEWRGELRHLKGHLSKCIHVAHQSLYECENQCGAELTEEEVVRHEQVCPLAMVRCEQCRDKIQRCQLDDHLHESCRVRPYQCPRCHTTGGYREMTTDHLKHCPSLRLPCPNEGCYKLLLINEIEQHLQECMGTARIES